MIKRLSVLLLVVLVALLSCAHADDAPAEAPAAESAPTEQAPPGVTILGDREPVPTTHEQLEQFIGGGGFIPTGGITYRWRYTFPFAGGFRYGWRYPLGYWNTFGRSIYGGSCLFGRPFGGYFYC